MSKLFILLGVDLDNDTIWYAHGEEANLLGLLAEVMMVYDKEGANIPAEEKEKMKHLWSLETIDDVLDIWHTYEKVEIFIQEVIVEAPENNFPWFGDNTSDGN